MSNWESEKKKKRVEGEETKSEWVSCHGIHMQPATSFEKTFVWKPKKKSIRKKVGRKSKKENSLSWQVVKIEKKMQIWRLSQFGNDE